MKVIRITKSDAEKVASSLIGKEVFLSEGMNKFSYKEMVNSCTMDVSFVIILPVFQQVSELICFFLEDKVKVQGRGSKTYGDGIIFQISHQFYESRIEYAFSRDNKNEKFVIGYSDPNHNTDIYKAKHIYIEYLNYEDEREENVSSCESIELQVTDLQKIIIYQTGQKGAILTANGVYSSASDYAFKQYEDVLTHLPQADKFVIVDNKGRVFVKNISVHLIEEVQASYCNDGIEEYVVVNDILYSQVDILGKFTSEELILLKNRLYMEIDKAHVVFARGDLIPLFRANIKSLTPIEGKGLYSKTKLNGLYVVIVPLSMPVSSWGSANYLTHETTIVVADKSIYAVVGDYQNVGFGFEEIGWYRGDIVVMERPENSYKNFYECYNDIPASLLESIEKQIEIEFFDDNFKEKAPLYTVGDTVLISKELTDTSTLKGLTAVIEEISNNKKKLTLKFFNYFSLELDTDYVQKF